MKSLNLGILAHVDAGKTSLTERLLFDTGVIGHLGSVNSGSTQTDSLELERKRGITIQSSVVSFYINNININLIDTPGHADFISEVERALSVLDAVILVVSAVEGIQAQTRILMNTLKKMKTPTLIFVNKIDRKGALYENLIKDINQQLKIKALPIVGVLNIGSKEAKVTAPFSEGSIEFKTLLECLADNNDEFLASYIDKASDITQAACYQQLAIQTAQSIVHPIFFGSAVTGAGITQLIDGIASFLPAKQLNSDGPPTGSIFKIERGNSGEKIAYLYLKSGTIEVRKSIELTRTCEGGIETFAEKASSIMLFKNGGLVPVQFASAGSVIQVTGLKSTKIGDSIGKCEASESTSFFSRPTLKTTIAADNPEDNIKLVIKLNELAEQDPLISMDKNQQNNELTINLYGEVQKEIIKELLESECGIKVSFSHSKMICIERPIQTGEAVNIMDLHNAPLEFYATLGFRIEPGAVSSGIHYEMQAQLGSLPRGYHSVVRESVFEFLKSGLSGWPVTDCIVTLTHTGLCPLSISPHFRQLTPILMQEALEKAQTTVCEPVSHFELDVPPEMLNKVLLTLSSYGATVKNGALTADVYRLEGELLTKHVHTISEKLPGITQGSGVFICSHAGFRST